MSGLYGCECRWVSSSYYEYSGSRLATDFMDYHRTQGVSPDNPQPLYLGTDDHGYGDVSNGRTDHGCVRARGLWYSFPWNSDRGNYYYSMCGSPATIISSQLRIKVSFREPNLPSFVKEYKLTQKQPPKAPSTYEYPKI